MSGWGASGGWAQPGPGGAGEAPAQSAPTATVFGSTAADAALTPQDTVAALSGGVVSPSEPVTVQWSVISPRGTDETAAILSSATAAVPTWGDFDAGSLHAAECGGFWYIIAKITSVATGLSTTYTRQIQVGDDAGLVTLDVSSASLTWNDGSVSGVYVSAADQGDGSVLLTLDGDVGAQCDGFTEAPTAAITGLYAAGTRTTVQVEVLGTRSDSWCYAAVGLRDTSDNNPGGGVGIADQSTANVYRLYNQAATGGTLISGTDNTAAATMTVEVGGNAETSNTYGRAYDASGNLIGNTSVALGVNSITSGEWYIGAGFAQVPSAGNQTIQVRVKARRTAL